MHGPLSNTFVNWDISLSQSVHTWCVVYCCILFSYATHIAGFRFGIFLKTDFFQCH